MIFNIIGNKMSIDHMQNRTTICLTPNTNGEIINKEFINKILQNFAMW